MRLETRPHESSRFRQDRCGGVGYFEGDRLARAVARVEKIRATVAADGTAAGRSLADVALQFVLAHPAVSTVIPGIRTPDQARRNCAVSGLPPQSPSLTAALRAHAWRRGVWYGGKA